MSPVLAPKKHGPDMVAYSLVKGIALLEINYRTSVVVAGVPLELNQTN